MNRHTSGGPHEHRTGPVTKLTLGTNGFTTGPVSDIDLNDDLASAGAPAALGVDGAHPAGGMLPT